MATTSTATPSAPGTTAAEPVVLPTYPTVDQGVLAEVAFLDATSEELVAELGVEASEEGDGLRLTLEGCFQRGPGQWVLSGNAELPAGMERAKVGMWAGFTQGDVGTGYLVVATVTGSGPFAFGLDRLAAATQREVPYSVWWDRPEACDLWVEAADTPALRDGGTSAPTISTAPVTWAAPEGTIQALGVGADLGDPQDWRLSWAYATLLRRSLPFEEVWLPASGGYALVNAGLDHETSCRYMVTESDAVQILQWADCDFDPPRVVGQPTDLPGWVEVDYYGRPSVASVVDGAGVRIESPRGLMGVDGLLEIAAGLVPYRNLWYTPVAPPPGASTDLDSAVQEALAAGGWTERGRFEVWGSLKVVATRVGEDDIPGRVYALARIFTARQLSSGDWILIDDAGGGGSSDFCYNEFGSEDAEGGYVIRWVAEPDWSIQTRRDGKWVTIPAPGGFSFERADPRDSMGLPTRALDAAGRVVRCSTFGWYLEEGEEWSPYRPPDSVRDLPVVVTPSTGLRSGQVVTVEGSGFYPSTGVEIRMCLAASAQWDDWLDCDEEEPAYERTGAAGFFRITEVRVRPTFTTPYGLHVDCRVEACILRVSANTGVWRYGWVPLEFAA
ncbi:MAG: hypothetical protein FJW79_02640 [Actinobacteria bacterium]|nr:hypothetical protein [Actinomycetota bacterium]